MNISTILDYIELFDSERDTGSDETDEARAITAINIVQDWFELLAISEPEILQTHTTLTTTANTEATTWPASLLRLDSIWYVDTGSTPNLPQYALLPIRETGGHRPALSWPEATVLTASTGKPRRYFATSPLPGGRFLWEPVPDASYTLRYYGLIAASDYTARSDTFIYDRAAETFAKEATKILRMGRDDSIEDLKVEAARSLQAALRAYSKFWNDGPLHRHYEDVHET